MKFEGRWKIAIIAVIAVVGISGIVQAVPHSSETAGDLAQDAALLALAIAICVLLTRLFSKRDKPAK